MAITITRDLNVCPVGVPPVIHLSQYDSDFTLVFNLYASTGTFTVPTGTTAEIRGTKRDGNGYDADATVSGTTVTVTGNEQMTAIAGANIYEIALYKNSKQLFTSNFILAVEPSALDANTITSESVLKELNAIIAGAAIATQAASDAAASAAAAAESARTLTIDNTLTQQGQAADAKKVGDEITEIKDDLDELVYDKTTSTSWEKGFWSVSDGSALSADIYIRYTGGFVSDDVVKMEVASGYLLGVWAWARSNNTYVGILQRDGTFAKNGSTSKAVSSFDTTDYPQYKFKIAMLRNPSSIAITPSEGVNCFFYTLKEEDNADLDAYSGLICSGDYAVGDTLFDSTTVSAGDTLYYKTHLLEASSSSGSAGYIALYNASDQRIACIGTLAIEQARINEVRMGSIVVPSGFSYAKWAGTKPGTVEYVTKYITPDYFEKFYGNTKVDLLSNPAYASDYRWDPNTKSQVANNAVGLTSFIPVVPGGKITLNKHLHGKNFGYAFFDANLAYVGQFASVCAANKTEVFEVPQNAYYVRLTFLLSTMSDAHAYYDAPPLDCKLKPEYELNPYVRRAIKQYGAYYLTQEFTHCMAPKICYFNGKIVLAYRCGYTHNGVGSTSLYGSIQVDTIEPDGILTHCALFKATDFGCVGDARDPFIGVSKDGKSLILLVSFNRGTAQSGSWDTALVHLDVNLSVVDYKKVISNTTQFAYGNPLITPEGHLIFNIYTPPGNLNQIIYRSNEVFTGAVSGLTFTQTTILTTTSSTQHNESCLGYHNGKLFMLTRFDSKSGTLMWTDNLEGTSGWSSPIDIGSKIHCPMLLPHHNGQYMPFICSFFDSSHANRYPVIGYLDVNTENQTVSIIGVGDMDPTLEDAANGYPGFVHLGGENYAVMYYQEDATNTGSEQNQQSGLYYKYINAREIVPGAVYFLD